MKIIIAIVFLFQSALLFAGNDRWTLIGPCGSGSQDFQFDGSTGTIYTTGGFRSLDHGNTWELLGIGSVPTSLLRVDPFHLNSIVIAGYSVYRSENQGKIFKEVDHTPFGVSDGYLRYASDFEFDTTLPDVLFATAQGHFFKSTDAAKTWVEVPVNANDFLLEVEIDPQNGNNVFVLGKNGFYFSSNGGGAWRSLSLGFNLREGLSVKLKIDPHNSQVLYIADGIEVFKTTDGGQHWTPTHCNCSAEQISIDLTNSHQIYVGGSDGLFKSPDGAVTWTRLRLPANDGAGGIGIDPLKRLIFVSGYYTPNFFRSSDSGQSWQTTNRGLAGLPVEKILADPSQPGHLITLLPRTFRRNVLQTTDFGQSWKYIHPLQFVEDIQIHPRQPGLIAAAGYFGISISENSGKTWLPAHGPSASHVAFSSKDERTIYAIAYQGRTDQEGFAKTNNLGERWTLNNKGLPNTDIRSIAVNPNNGDEILVGADDATDQFIFRSDDGGRTWKGVGNPFCCSFIDPIVFDPSGKNLYASTGLTLFKSTNGGKIWDAIGKGLLNVLTRSVFIDPVNSAIIYTAGPPFISLNAGLTFSNFDLNGLANSETHQFLVDPGHPNTFLLATTSGIYSYTRNVMPSGPIIEQINPAIVKPGNFVTIKGNNFGNTQGNSRILFGGIEADHGRKWSNGAISVQVPDQAKIGRVQITVKGVPSNSPELIVLPSSGMINPMIGSKNGGTRIVIQSPSDIILFGQTLAQNCLTIPYRASYITTCTAPPGKGTVSVSVVSNGLPNTQIVGQFTYR